jgi:BirA family transcriptional regulator, biotin operon repressor / biotin---[acetyl-CoA-carboxylase] ligase
VSIERPPLSAGELRTRLGVLIADLDVRDETGSTNADVRELAAVGAPEWTVVAAEHQVTGRGRLDRVWTSPPRAGLTFSVLLRPGDGVPTRRWTWLPMLAGCAVVEGIAETTGVQAKLKWPNDVLVGDQDRKVCGILLEAASTPVGTAAVIGIGLNVSTQTGELAAPTATSLALEGAADPDRAALLQAIVVSLHRLYDDWRAGAGEPGQVLELYSTFCATVGRQVRIQLGPEEWVEGQATGVDDDGRLVVRTPDGGERAFGAGDVVHVR